MVELVGLDCHLTKADFQDIFDSFSSMYLTIFCLGLRLPGLVEKEYNGDAGQNYYDNISHLTYCHPIVLGVITLLLAGGLWIFLQQKIKQQIIDYKNALEQKKLLINKLLEVLELEHQVINELDVDNKVGVNRQKLLQGLQKEQQLIITLGEMTIDLDNLENLPSIYQQKYNSLKIEEIDEKNKLVLQETKSDLGQERLSKFIDIISNPCRYFLLNKFSQNYSLFMAFAVVFACVNILMLHFWLFVAIVALFTLAPYILSKYFQWRAQVIRTSSGVTSQSLEKRYMGLIQDKQKIDITNQILSYVIINKIDTLNNSTEQQDEVTLKDHLTILLAKFAFCLVAMLNNIVGVLFGWQTCLFVLHELLQHISINWCNLIFNAIGHGPLCPIIFVTLLCVGIVYGYMQFKNMWDNHTLSQQEKNYLTSKKQKLFNGKQEIKNPLTRFERCVEFFVAHPGGRVLFDYIQFISIAKIFFVKFSFYFWPWAAVILPPPIFMVVIFGGALLYSLICFILNSVKYKDEKEITLLRQQFIEHVSETPGMLTAQQEQYPQKDDEQDWLFKVAPAHSL